MTIKAVGTVFEPVGESWHTVEIDQTIDSEKDGVIDPVEILKSRGKADHKDFFLSNGTHPNAVAVTNFSTHMAFVLYGDEMQVSRNGDLVDVEKGSVWNTEDVIRVWTEHQEGGVKAELTLTWAPRGKEA